MNRSLQVVLWNKRGPVSVLMMMGVFWNIFCALVLVGGTGSSALGVPSRLALENELALDIPTAAALSEKSAQASEPVVLPDGPMDVEIPDIKAPKAANSVTHIRGLQYADLKNEVMTLAYRTDRGIGLGAASTGGLALTAGYATEGGMRLNVYYVHTFSEISEGAARAAGIEAEDLPERSVGLTIGWRF